MDDFRLKHQIIFPNLISRLPNGVVFIARCQELKDLAIGLTEVKLMIR